MKVEKIKFNKETGQEEANLSQISIYVMAETAFITIIARIHISASCYFNTYM